MIARNVIYPIINGVSRLATVAGDDDDTRLKKTPNFFSILSQHQSTNCMSKESLITTNFSSWNNNTKKGWALAQNTRHNLGLKPAEVILVHCPRAEARGYKISSQAKK